MRLVLSILSLVLGVTVSQYDDLKFVCQPRQTHQCREPNWQLVFKAVSGVAQPTETDPLLIDPYAVWSRNAPHNEDIAAARQLDTSFQGHYKSSLVLNWERRNILEVKVALLDDTGNELIGLVFDGEGSNNMNWFSKNRLLSSPWNDIFMEPQNYFSVIGHDLHNRRWYINRNYGGCANDAGWLHVGGSFSKPVCEWEKSNEPKPTFLYSREKTFSNWNNEANVGEASIFAIFVKTKCRY